jgi:serine/threonine-protein kinase
MPETTPGGSDRNLLFGILALQMDFIDRDTLVRGMHAWVLDKAKPLGQVFREQGALAEDTHALLEALVAKHLALHSDNAQKSLAAVSSLGSVRDDLGRIADAEVQASLGHLASPSRTEDPDLTPLPDSEGRPSGPRFRILRPHAKGGLGQVYVAHDEELHREVALKEIQTRHAFSPDSRARFLLEAEVTGGLEHPGIVPVYGLGRYVDGRPYYAMRFIRGDSLQEAIARFHQAEKPGRNPTERRLAFRDLLGRFVDVCNAVAYAHSRGVLHRDLKPANVMLGRYGETLVVDWGLAKPTGRAGDGKEGEEPPLQPLSGGGVAATVAGRAVGTPAFMSPEQAQGRPDLLGPASDVYSLGATLYTLLTGRPPIPDAEVDVVLHKTAQGELVPPRQVNRRVPPALAAVCLKALALRPQARYPTALALAAEVEHWLADEPVSAYREPLGARLGRWGRRHKAAVAGVITLLVTAMLALAVSTVLISREQGRTEAARQKALHNFGKARAAVDLMLTRVSENKDLLLHLPRMAEVRRRLLEEALAFYRGLSEEDSADPQVRAEAARAYFRVGYINNELGRYAEAEGAWREAVSRFGQLAAEHPAVPGYRQDLAQSHNNLGNLLQVTGRRKEAEESHRAALDLRERLAQEHPGVPDYRIDLADSHHNLGALRQVTGRPQEAEASYRAALALQERLAQEHPAVPGYRDDLAQSHNNLGNLLQATGRRKEAEASCRAALDLRQRLAEEHPDVPGYRNGLAYSHNNLGILLRDTGRLKEAEAPYRAALVLRERLAAEHPAVPAYRHELAASHNNLGILLQVTGRLKEAEASYRAARDLRQRLAHDYPAMPDYRNGLAGTMVNLANLLRDRKDLRGARRVLEQALDHHQAALRANPNHPGYRSSYRTNRWALADTLVRLGDHATAAEASAQFAQAAVDRPTDLYNAACYLANCVPLAEKDSNLPEAKRQELARSYADRALDTLRQALKSGYKDLANMKKDPDLDPLRQRADFQKLLQDLEKAK